MLIMVFILFLYFYIQIERKFFASVYMTHYPGLSPAPICSVIIINYNQQFFFSLISVRNPQEEV